MNRTAQIIKDAIPSLEVSGDSHKCLCPFHEEKTPSLHVDIAAGRFHCFGCGAKGSLSDLLAKAKGISSSEAEKLLS